MKNKKIKIVMLIISIGLLIVIYNVYNNNRVKVVKEKIKIENLPDAFDGFTILQLTDLHEKRFGKNQKNLAKKINKSNYDMIAIAGDMYSSYSKDDKPLLELIDAIKNKENIFYVPGNHGPEYNEKLEYRGVISLNKPYELKKGNDIMWIYDFYDGDNFKFDAKHVNDKFKLAITHYPWDKDFYTNFAPDNIGKYDLVLAGHYHGGQIRIPLIGALFVPNINEMDIFPKQRDVSGYNNYNGYNQYVSRGLGANSNNKLFRFRLFNTPEINLITLVKK